MCAPDSAKAKAKKVDICTFKHYMLNYFTQLNISFCCEVCTNKCICVLCAFCVVQDILERLTIVVIFACQCNSDLALQLNRTNCV